MRALIGVVCVSLALLCMSIQVVPSDASAGDVGPSGFLPRKDYSVGKGADGVEIGDINGDGKNELVVANRVTSNLSLFKQTGSSTDPLQWYQTEPVGWPPAVVAIADINQDGLNDVAVAHYDNYVGSGKTNTFGVCYQNPTSHLLDPETNYTFPSGQSSRAIAAGDANSDGKAEVVVANEVSGNKVFVWGWNSTSSKLEVIGSYSGVSPYVISITVGDVTGDGKGDVMTYGSDLYVLEQDNSGKLKAPVNYGSTGGESGDIGDVNGDGLNDVAGSTAFSGEMQVWLQTASHTLKLSGTYTAGSYTEDTEVADLNNDGRTDILTSSRDNSEAWLFLQDSSGNLSQPIKFVSIPSKWLNELAVGDLNNDAVTDFAGSNWGEMGISNPQWTTVSVWIQNVTTPVAPKVVSTNPVDKATNVSVSTNIEVTFSKAMNKSATEGAFSISPTATGSFSWSFSDTVMAFDPSADLANDTKYSVTISKSAKDAQGINMQADYVFSFTTEKLTGPAPPTVVSTSPANGATNVPSGVRIIVTFSKAMDKSATESATSASPSVTWTGAWSSGDTIVTFTPSSKLKLDTKYMVNITTSAKSADGANMASQYTFSFTTVKCELPVPPTIISTSPSGNSVDVPLDVKISITFNMSMNRTPTEGSVSASPTISWSPGWTSGDTILTLTPSSDLPTNTKYTITVSTSARSAAGGEMTSPYQFSFTTISGGDTTPPTVLSTNPTNGSKDVDIKTKISITYDKPMNKSVTESAVTITPGSISMKTWSNDNKTLTLLVALDGGKTYTVTISNSARDRGGNRMIKPYAFSFTTAIPACGDCGAPAIPLMLLFLIPLVIIIIAITLILLLMRKKKKQQPQPMPQAQQYYGEQWQPPPQQP